MTEKLTQPGNTAAHAIPPIITTQIQKPCPQAIIRGFINQVDIDPTLRIVCLVGTNKNFTTTILKNNDNKNHPKKEKTIEEEKQTSNIIMENNDKCKPLTNSRMVQSSIYADPTNTNTQQFTFYQPFYHTNTWVTSLLYLD